MVAQVVTLALVCLALKQLKFNRSIAQLGRAPALGAGGRRFESCFSDQTKEGNSLRARIGGEGFCMLTLHTGVVMCVRAETNKASGAYSTK